MSTVPANGKVRWLEDDPVTGEPRIRITTSNGTAQEYDVEHRYSDKYRMWRLDPNTFSLVSYDVSLRKGLQTCTCPDAVYRRQGLCKHIRGLQAALDALPF